jgi:hypothetical protein
LDATGLGLTDGNWHFICGVRDPSVGIRKIYHNGIEVASLTGDTYTASGSGTPIVIGGENADSYEYPGSLISATIDEVLIINRSLTADEIYQLYLGGYNRTIGNNVHRVTSYDNLNNIVFNLTDHDSSSQYDYDQRKLLITGYDYGISNYAEAPSIDVANGTWSAWINLNSTWDSKGRIVSRDSWYLAVTADRKISFGLNINGWQEFVGTQTISKSEWHHIAATYDGSKVRLYLDGNLDKEYVQTGIPTGIEIITIGRRSDGAEPFNGLIDEIKIFNTSLTEKEIKSEYETSYKKLTATGRTDRISSETNVTIVLSNPTGKAYFDDIAVKTGEKKVRLTIPYAMLDLNSSLRISKGTHQIRIENKGLNETTEKPVIEISKE